MSSVVPPSSTLQVTKVPPDLTNQEFETFFSDFGPLRRCFTVKKTQLGYVQFAFEEDAHKCLAENDGILQVQHDGKLHKMVLKKAKDKVDKRDKKKNGDEVKEEEAENDKALEQRRFDAAEAKKKKARLVVRNLSFKASEAQVKEHFSAVGEVTEVKILVKPDGKRVGCGFVQFSSVPEAAEAIKKLNRSDLVGRTIAVDWAVAKGLYQKNEEVKTEIKEEPESEVGTAAAEVSPVKMEIKEEPESDEDSSDDGDGDSGGDDDDDGDSEDDANDDEDDDDDEDSDKDDSSPDFLTGANARDFNKPWPKTGHDISENRTLFLRNLSFDSDQQDLREMMEQNFGKVLFARLVVDKMTEMPKGTAFVKFQDSESVEKALKASESKEGLWLDDRQFYACRALQKEEADENVKKKKEKEAKDSRNLHLAVEGLIRQGTKAAIGVSKSDMEQRTKVEKWKRGVLKDLNMFVSPNRLCVRNLPPTLTDQQLRKVFLKAVGDKKAKLTEAKVIKDMKAKGVSKGYAFVAFEQHEHALKCLRFVNNNPDIFTRDARPIVEFSIENKKAVNAREKRLEKSRENNPNFKGGKGAKQKDQKTNEFKRPGQKEVIEDKADFMGTINNPKQRSLPSHMGPKVRHNRPNTAISRKDIKKAEKNQKMKNKRKNPSSAGAGEASDISDIPPAKAPRLNGSSAGGNNGAAQGASGEVKSKKNRKKKKFSKAATHDYREEKQFTELVNKYRVKLDPGQGGLPLRNKWFEG